MDIDCETWYSCEECKTLEFYEEKVFEFLISLIDDEEKVGDPGVNFREVFSLSLLIKLVAHYIRLSMN